ncbi:Uncharacterised protein [Mycobacteroides abscessus subsp. bolletii]|nr:Uncharacterised protein [Mycobacteroides abscessus subsp. bolletii]SKS19148.1 Uncharacterised protein [Mycobacteroides abscessus subsp. abscessus]SHW44690.1 Uncharacterised protein [Mycobacteroides abscessus subsp. bolletii]SHW81183.1 Uncharacterised protein [Mycobacteroides abscessus subsp. bolletii]SHX01230.1 Uncharacterised protein [Mycobacteroides abscessus subsp. bolletii]
MACSFSNYNFWNDNQHPLELCQTVNLRFNTSTVSSFRKQNIRIDNEHYRHFWIKFVVSRSENDQADTTFLYARFSRH